jgi:3-methylcrotonyl-CoA carboxylase alpha subunit
VVEETPSPAVDDALRQAMTSAAVELGRKLGYLGAGTAEFILDEKTRRFFFLELNTRLQVEHPITEAISGLDLVELQLLVAQGANLKELGLLDNIPFQGHAIEVRLCAEDPDNDFGPRTGVIQKWSPANAAKDLPGVRYDTGIEDGSEISVYYDSMVAKVIVHAPTRAEAVRRMIMALSRTVILGVTTNQKFLISIMNNPRFQSGTFDTNFITLENDRLFQKTTTALVQSSVVAATLFDWCVRKNQQVHLRNMAPNWRNVPWRNPSVRYLINQEQEVSITYAYQGNEQRDYRHAFQCGVALASEEAPKSKEDPKKIAQGPELSLSAVLYDADFGKETPGPKGVQGAKGLLRATIGR